MCEQYCAINQAFLNRHDAFGVTYHLIQNQLKIDVTQLIIAYTVTPIRWQKRANYIGARSQQLCKAYQAVQLQQTFPSRKFLECI